MPFPAVTFCNLNPYKKSALAKLPQLASLMNAYKSASQSDTANAVPSNDKTAPSNTQKKTNVANLTQVQGNRYKRSSCSSCSGASYYETMTTDLSRIFKLLGVAVTWDCAFACCAQNAPAGFTGISRVARLDNDTLINYLVKQLIIPLAPPTPQPWPWCGLKGDSSGNYYWYDDPTTISGPPVTAASSICSNCVAGTSYGWSLGGPTTVIAQASWNPPPIRFDNYYDYATSFHLAPPICECEYHLYYLYYLYKFRKITISRYNPHYNYFINHFNYFDFN